MDLIKQHPAIVLGTLGLVLVAAILLRRGGGSVSGDLPPNVAALQAESIGANRDVVLAGIDSNSQLNALGASLRLAEIQGPTQLAIARAEAASADSQNSATLAAMIAMANINANAHKGDTDAASQAHSQDMMYSLLAPFAAGAAYAAFA